MSAPPPPDELEKTATAVFTLVAELGIDARAPVVHAIDSETARRFEKGLLSANDVLAAWKIELDYRENFAGKGASLEALLALKWKTLRDSIGPEPATPFDLARCKEAATAIHAEEARRERIAVLLSRGMTCGALLATEFPPPQWIVPGLLVSGLTILAGAPKLGKSWLALALGAAVGSGGSVLGRYHVERRKALYLALEDTPHRLKNRLEKIGASPVSKLDLFTQWRAGGEGIEDLDAYLEECHDIKLVLVDTLARFRGQPQGDDRYAEDYRAAAAIKTVADRHDCAIIVVHHVRKMAAEDIMDTVSGSNGLNGAADSTWILTRSRGEAGAQLS